MFPLACTPTARSQISFVRFPLSPSPTCADSLIVAERFSKDTCGAASRIRSRTVRVVTWTFFGVAVVFVAARFVARPERFKGSGYGTDDWTILACLALLLPFCAIIQAMTDNGLGADNYTLSADEITTMLKVGQSQNILSLLS